MPITLTNNEAALVHKLVHLAAKTNKEYVEYLKDMKDATEKYAQSVISCKPFTEEVKRCEKETAVINSLLSKFNKI